MPQANFMYKFSLLVNHSSFGNILFVKKNTENDILRPNVVKFYFEFAFYEPKKWVLFAHFLFFDAKNNAPKPKISK